MIHGTNCRWLQGSGCNSRCHRCRCGAIGGAVVWRLRVNLALGGALTACAYVLALLAEHPEDVLWLRAKLTWGAPSVVLAFLICSVSALWLKARTTLRSTWIAASALGLSLSMGFLYLLLFRLGLRAPLVAALAADICLVFLLILRQALMARARRGDVLTKPRD